MSKVGYGYGSEYHLMRYLAYHRGVLKQQVDEATGGELINWLDFPFSASPQRFYHDSGGASASCATTSAPGTSTRPGARTGRRPARRRAGTRSGS